MKNFKLIIVTGVFALLSASCGVEGDPGHCFISIEWEYYNENYRVYYYEDNNPDIPTFGVSKAEFVGGDSYYRVSNSGNTASEEIVAGQYYESYPGKYDYYYESEDSMYLNVYEGIYELIQNPGSPGGLLHDGLDGADTYFDLYLYIKPDSLRLAPNTSLKRRSEYIRKGLVTGERIMAAAEKVTAAKMLPVGAIDPSAGTDYDNTVASRSGRIIKGDPLKVENHSWQKQQGNWVLRVEEQVKVYMK
jgi:hypothetical protein